MRVIVADDHREVRQALRLLFEQESIEVVAEVSAADALVGEVARTPADLLLLDWELSGESGVAMMQAVRTAAPSLRVVALSGRPEVRGLALAQGVEGFVSKADPPERLLRALDEAAGAQRPAAGRQGEA